MKHRISAPANRGREFDNGFGESNFIKSPTKQTPFNRQQALEEIAISWASRGFYASPAQAMYALLTGVLE